METCWPKSRGNATLSVIHFHPQKDLHILQMLHHFLFHFLTIIICVMINIIHYSTEKRNPVTAGWTFQVGLVGWDFFFFFSGGKNDSLKIKIFKNLKFLEKILEKCFQYKNFQSYFLRLWFKWLILTWYWVVLACKTEFSFSVALTIFLTGDNCQGQKRIVWNSFFKKIDNTKFQTITIQLSMENAFR